MNKPLYRADFLKSSGLFLATTALTGCAGSIAAPFLKTGQNPLSGDGITRRLQSSSDNWKVSFSNTSSQAVWTFTASTGQVVAVTATRDGIQALAGGKTLFIPKTMTYNTKTNLGNGVVATRNQNGFYFTAPDGSSNSGYLDSTRTQIYANVPFVQISPTKIFNIPSGGGGGQWPPRQTESCGWLWFDFALGFLGIVAAAVGVGFGCASVILCGFAIVGAIAATDAEINIGDDLLNSSC